MDLKKYKELTGLTIPTSKEAKVTANIRRTKSKLEAMLGFSLKPKNLYTEKGKVQLQGYLPIEDTAVLLPPDVEEGVYKLFPYDETDKYFHVDPFTAVHRVKLVMPTTNGEFITVTDLDNVVPKYGRDAIGKYIERHYEWFTWQWYRTYMYSYSSSSDAGLMLAIDADWITCYPDDVMYLWADMVEFHANPNKNLKSESVDGHSWSTATNEAPEDDVENKQLLARYAGPYGSVARNPVR